jgi:hypothetical protein
MKQSVPVARAFSPLILLSNRVGLGWYERAFGLEVPARTGTAAFACSSDQGSEN